MDFESIPLFVAFASGRLEHDLHEAKAEAVKAGAALIAQQAKDLIGEPHPELGWPPLEPATIARKALGDTPLLETGEMRDSIGFHIIDHENAEIGSNDDIAVYQELGTSTIPPRPFLSAAAVLSEKACTKLLAKATKAVFKGLSIEGEILKIAADTLRDLAHDFGEFVERNDEGEPRER